MDSLEAWLDFRRGESYSPPRPRCAECGLPCSGNTGLVSKPNGKSVPICDHGTGCSVDEPVS